MSDQKTPRKRGRPPKFLGSEDRVSRSLRMMPGVEARLREAAEANHRSIAEELEYRINQSFDALVINPPSDMMFDLKKSAEEHKRGVEEEVISRLSEPDIVDKIRSTLLSDDFADKQTSIMTNFLQKHRIGIVIGRLLAAEADKALPPYSDNTVSNKNIKKLNVEKRKNLNHFESEFEKSFGIGIINHLIDAYDDEVLRLVMGASRGKFIVVKGRLQEVKKPAKVDNGVLFFTSENDADEVYVMVDKCNLPT